MNEAIYDIASITLEKCKKISTGINSSYGPGRVHNIFIVLPSVKYQITKK